MDINQNQKSNKSNQSNTFIDYLIKNVSIFTVIIMGVFVFLDYRVFTNTFNLYPSTFLDTYVIDAFHELSLLSIVITPLVLSLFLLSIAYISAFMPWSYYLKIRKIIIIYKSNWSILVLSLVHYFILFILSVIMDNIQNVIWLAFMLGATPLIANMLIIPFLLQYTKINKSLSSYYIICFTVIYISISSICSFIIVYQDINSNIMSILSILYFLIVLSLTLLLIITMSEVKTKPIKNNMSVIISIFIILIVSIIFSSDDDNKNIWSSNKDYNYSYSLRINKLFQSVQPIRINVDTSDFNISTTKLKNIKEKYLLEIIKDNTLSLQNSKYLPLSKENKLYFVDSNDSNITFVFAIKQKYNQGIYDYKLIDIGFIKMINK